MQNALWNWSAVYNHKLYLDKVEEADRNHVDHMLRALDNYCKQSTALGDFLQAVIIGDLYEAAGRADDVNIKYLALYARYCYNQLPSTHVHLVKPLVRAIRELSYEAGLPQRSSVSVAADTFFDALRNHALATIAARIYDEE